MRGRTGLFKRVVSLAVTMSVLLSIGVTVHASSFYKGEVKINTMYDPAQQGGGYEYYGPDFYFTFTPTYTGDFNFNIRKSHPSDPTGRVSVYTGMSGEGAGFYDEVACWDITQTDFTPDTCHTLTLQNDTTYYIRFYAQSGYPAFAFYMDDTSHSFCHVTFHSSDVPGGSDEEVAECDLSRGYSSYLPNVNFTSRENQRVAGWSLEAGGELLYRAGDLITIGADQEPFNLYAVWGDRLSFNINEGTGDAIPDTGILSGDVVTLPECSWTKNGAAFVGWSLNADGTGTRYYPGDIFNFTEPTTFYAQYEGQASYEPLYQLSADANKMYLDIYVPYFNNSSSTALYLDNEVQDPYRRGVVVDSKTYDVYSISCPARCMTVPHTVEIRYGDSVLFTGSISVRSYLRSIINSSSSSDKQKDAARAMLRYGAAAQIYFDGLTEGDPSIANYEIRGAEISSLANMTIWQEHDLDFILWKFSGLTCSTYYGMNLTFTDEMTLMIAFQIKDGYTFEQAQEELRGRNYFRDEGDIQVDGSGHYCIVRYNNVHLFQLNTDLSFNLPIIPSEYLGRVSEDENVNVNYRNLCLALYAYYTAAYRLT